MENKNLPENTPENENSVNFSANEEITPVKAEEESKSKRLPLVITACVLVIAVIVGAVIYFTTSDGNHGNNHEHATDDGIWDEQKLLSYFDSQLSDEELTDEEGASVSRQEYIKIIQKKVQEATTTLGSNVGTKSPVAIVENTTAAIKQGVTASNTEQADKALAQIKAFFDRSCYFEGALYSSGEGNAMAMSLDGDNMETLANLDGTEVSLLKLDGKLYLKRPAMKQYVEFTDAVTKMMGFSIDDLQFDFGATSYEKMQNKLVASYDVTVDGKDGVCYRYAGTDRTFNFYSVDGELKQITTTDTNGVVDTEIYISKFSESIPGDQLTLKGFTQASLMTMFADFMDTED